MNKYFPVGLILFIIVIFGCENSKTHNASVDSTDSITVLNELIVNDSLNPILLASRAKIYFDKGKIDPALRDLQAALELSPNNPELFILLSDIYFVLGQLDNCIASLKKAIRLSPDDEYIYIKLSETYLMLNKHEVAIQYADQAIRRNRQSAEAYYTKAIGLLENSDTLAALQNFAISANLDTNNYMTYMQIGAIYLANNDTLLKTYFEKALEVKPNDERALYYLGMFYQENKNFNKAIEKFSKITDLYPDNKRVYYNMGYMYLVELEDYENAKIMFQEAINISPSFVEAVYNLGRTLEAMGDYPGARVQYKISLELLPNYPLAVQGMNRLDDIQYRQN